MSPPEWVVVQRDEHVTYTTTVRAKTQDEAYRIAKVPGHQFVSIRQIMTKRRN